MLSFFHGEQTSEERRDSARGQLVGQFLDSSGLILIFILIANDDCRDPIAPLAPSQGLPQVLGKDSISICKALHLVYAHINESWA